LSPFYRAIESSIEEGGRPAFDPPTADQHVGVRL
jgi:hypothetical protein